MTVKRRYTAFLIFLIVCLMVLFHSVYVDVKSNTIKEYNRQQMILAKQAADGIEGFFSHHRKVIEAFATEKDIIDMTPMGEKIFAMYINSPTGNIQAISRMGADGKIIYSYPDNEKIVGMDISYQTHVKKILETHKPVFSDVFHAVQGCDAVAYHVPVIKDGIFKGSIAILVSFMTIAERYLDNIHIGKNGYAWVISEKGTNIYHPKKNELGDNIFKTEKDFPSLLVLAERMTAGEKGTGFYSYKDNNKLIKKHVAFLPAKVGDTFWSIAVTTPEKQVLQTMENFRNKIIIIILITFLTVIVYLYSFIRARLVLKEEAIKKEARKALEESEIKHRQLFENNTAGIATHEIIIDGKGKPVDYVFLSANRAFEKHTGLKVNDIIGKRVTEVLPGIEETPFIDIYGKTALTGEPVSFENEEPDPLGRYYTINVYQLEKGCFATVFSDITRQKLADKTLQESEERFRTIFNISKSAIIIHNFENDKVIAANPAYFEMTGFDEKDKIGRTSYDDEFESISKEEWQKVKEYLKDTGGRGSGRFTIIKKNKETREVIGSSAITVIDGTKCIVSVMQDITEQVKLEEQLKQSQKMEAIGQLAGGVAHDFNNMLVAIMGSAELLYSRLEGDRKNQKTLQTIIKASTQASELISKLLSFSRKGKILSTAINVDETIKEAVLILERSVDKNISIKYTSQAEHSSIIGDPSQIQNVLINLGLNARDAMPKGGRISISTENKYLDEEFCENVPFNIKEGKFIKISVADTGSGIPQENLENIFEPFFTTKETGKGTGLGLAAVYGAIKDHHGAIAVDSDENGTTFEIYIPVEENYKTTEKSYKKEIKKGSGCILIVDDEDLIRSTCSMMLEELGYEVLIANSGEEGIEIYKKEKDRIDIILLDMVMPEMSGKECLEKLRKINSDIKVIISTGFVKDDRITEMNVNGFIKKPYRLDEINEAIIKAMNS